MNTFADGTTPLDGWHWVCPCGWTAHGNPEPPYKDVSEHRASHLMHIARLHSDRAERSGARPCP